MTLTALLHHYTTTLYYTRLEIILDARRISLGRGVVG